MSGRSIQRRSTARWTCATAGSSWRPWTPTYSPEVSTISTRNSCRLCVQAVMAAVEKICPGARSVLLIPENHTRNMFYLQNLAALQASCAMPA